MCAVFQWQAMPLADNFIQDTYKYEIHFYTGVKPNAGTDSNIKFVIAGTECDTGRRVLSDEIRMNFQSGDVSTFLLRSPVSLGIPAAIRMWHDNSGQGKKASWFLSKVVIVDLQTGEWYFFKCDKWLALDEDDGKTDRLLTLSTKEDIASDNELLRNNVAKAIWNDHIWLSVAYRKTRSTFTRVQRVSCCLAILFLTMAANAMFYGTGSDDTAESAFTIGPISITVQEIYTSIASSIVIVPPIILITTIFAKTQEKPVQTKSSNPKNGDGLMQSNTKKTPLATGKKWPHWCIYVAWLLVFTAVASGAFFTILYALQWGKTKSEAWLMTFFMSFFQSVFFIQPIKVLT